VSSCKLSVAGVGVFLSRPLGMLAFSVTASIILGGRSECLRNHQWDLGHSR
jgi:hypothetical protein